MAEIENIDLDEITPPPAEKEEQKTSSENDQELIEKPRSQADQT